MQEIFDFLPELIRYFNIPKEKFPIGVVQDTRRKWQTHSIQMTKINK